MPTNEGLKSPSPKIFEPINDSERSRNIRLASKIKNLLEKFGEESLPTWVILRDNYRTINDSFTISVLKKGAAPDDLPNNLPEGFSLPAYIMQLRVLARTFRNSDDRLYQPFIKYAFNEFGEGVCAIRIEEDNQGNKFFSKDPDTINKFPHLKIPLGKINKTFISRMNDAGCSVTGRLLQKAEEGTIKEIPREDLNIIVVGNAHVPVKVVSAN